MFFFKQCHDNNNSNTTTTTTNNNNVIIVIILTAERIFSRTQKRNCHMYYSLFMCILEVDW